MSDIHPVCARRQAIPASPVQAEFHLTSTGRDAGPVLDAIIAWSHKWIPVPPGANDDASHPGDREHTAPDSGSLPAVQEPVNSHSG